MPKLMLKFEAEKNPKSSSKLDLPIDPGRSKGRFLGGPGGRGADFRPYLADFIRSSITLGTPAGCGGCFFVQNRASGAPGSIDCAIRGVLVRCQKNMFFQDSGIHGRLKMD